MGPSVFQFLKNSSADKALAEALGRSQAVIEFGMDGIILTANNNFLTTLGYSLGEIQGKHHSMFVAPSERDSAAYRDFWAALKRGEYQAAEYKRIGKGGKEVWIQATYNPVLDGNGKPFKVVKFASDITARKIQNMEDAGQIAAVSRAQAVIAFEMDAAKTSRPNTSESARAAKKSGSSPPITRCSTRRASRSGW
jgi:methyl-accepting chemotaxis protein